MFHGSPPDELLKNQMAQYYNLLMLNGLSKQSQIPQNPYLAQMMLSQPQFAVTAQYLNYLKMMAAAMASSNSNNQEAINQKGDNSAGSSIHSNKNGSKFNNKVSDEKKSSCFNSKFIQQKRKTPTADISQVSCDSKDKQKFFKCPIKNCDKVFPKECNLKDHIRTHTGEKPFKCSFPTCNRSFSQQGNLKKHEKVHLGEKKFICEHPGCGKNFSASYNLKIHYRCHTGEKPYKCTFEECDRSFYDKGNLKYHEKTAHSLEVKSYPFSCEHIGCNLKFKTKKQKLLHHNEFEPQCREEKYSIIRLISKFRSSIISLVKQEGLNVEEIEKMDEFCKLQSEFDETSQKLFDNEYFFASLGEKFEFETNSNLIHSSKEDDSVNL